MDETLLVLLVSFTLSLHVCLAVVSVAELIPI